MDAKLSKLRDLLNQKADIDAEIAAILGDAPKTGKRGRPRKENGETSSPSLPLQTGEE